jgi:hypothetical protein
VSAQASQAVAKFEQLVGEAIAGHGQEQELDMPSGTLETGAIIGIAVGGVCCALISTGACRDCAIARQIRRQPEEW